MAEKMYEHGWMEFTRGSWAGLNPIDELHALYLKACQRKAQDERYASDPDVHPWVMAMWPQQPQPMTSSIWTPNMRLGWALASPPDGGKAIGSRAVPTLGQDAETVAADIRAEYTAAQILAANADTATKKAIEGTIVE